MDRIVLCPELHTTVPRPLLAPVTIPLLELVHKQIITSEDLSTTFEAFTNVAYNTGLLTYTLSQIFISRFWYLHYIHTKNGWSDTIQLVQDQASGIM